MTDVSEPTTKGHPFFLYTVARIALLLVVGGLFYLCGFRDLLLIVLAFLVSGMISFFVLDRYRDAMGIRMSGYFKRMNQKIDAGAISEDEIISKANDEHDDAVSQAAGDPADEPVGGPAVDLSERTTNADAR